MTLNNVICIDEYQKKKRKEKRRKTLGDKIRIGMLALSAAGFIGSFGAMWNNFDKYNETPEAVVQYQELKGKLQGSVSASELLDSPNLGDKYFRMRTEYEQLTADPERMSVVEDYNDSQHKAANYLLLACACEVPLVWGVAGYFSRRRKEKEEP